MKVYRDMLFLDGDQVGYMENQYDLWQETAQMVDDLLQVQGNTLQEEAELCLTLMVCQQVGIRDDAKMHRAFHRTLRVLPRLQSAPNTVNSNTANAAAVNTAHLRTALLIFLYAETEDDDIRQEVEDHLFLLSDEADESALLLQVWQTIKDTVPYGIPVD